MSHRCCRIFNHGLVIDDNCSSLCSQKPRSAMGAVGSAVSVFLLWLLLAVTAQASSPYYSHAYAVSKCAVKLKSCMISTSSKGYVELNGVRVADFSTFDDGNSAIGPGLHLFSMDYHCQVTDHLRLFLNPNNGFMSSAEADILNYFLLSIPHGTSIIGVSCGGSGDDGDNVNLQTPLGALGVQTGSSIRGHILFVSRKGYPWHTVQRLPVPATPSQPFMGDLDYLETTVHQFPSYYSTNFINCDVDMPELAETEELNNNAMFIYPALRMECSGYIAGFKMHMAQNRPLQEHYKLYVGIWRGGQPLKKIRLDFYNMHADIPTTVLGYLYPHERVYVMPGDYLSIHSVNASSLEVHPLMFKLSIQKSSVYLDFERWRENPPAPNDWDKAIGAKVLYYIDEGDWSTLESYYYWDLDQSVDNVYELAQPGLQPLLVDNRYDHGVYPHGGSDKVSNNWDHFNDEEDDYSEMRAVYFFPNERLGRIGRVTSVRYRAINTGGFILLFYNDISDQQGHLFSYVSSVFIDSCLGDCHYYLPDDLYIPTVGNTFYALYYRFDQAVGNSDFTLGLSTQAYVDYYSTSYDVHTLHSDFKGGAFSNLISMGQQALPGIVIYIADFGYDDSLQGLPLPNAWLCTSSEDCRLRDEYTYCNAGQCECDQGFYFSDRHLACTFLDDIAQEKPAFQSSEHNYWNTSASKAVDLSTNDQFLYSFLETVMSCSRTEISENPWLVVDLGQQYWIHSLSVHYPVNAKQDSYLVIGGNTDTLLYGGDAAFSPAAHGTGFRVMGKPYWLAYVGCGSSSCSSCFHSGSYGSEPSIMTNPYSDTQSTIQCIKRAGDAFYRRVVDDRCLMIEDEMVELSPADGVTNCADGARLFYINGQMEMSAILASQASQFIIAFHCFYFKGNVQHGVPLYYGSPPTGCADLYPQTVGDDNFYWRYGAFYLAWNGTNIVVDQYEGDLFYKDIGYPVADEVQSGAYTVTLPSSTDRCTAVHTVRFSEPFSRPPALVYHLRNTVSFDAWIVTVKIDRFHFQVCHSSSAQVYSWVSNVLHWRATLNEFHDFTIGVGNHFDEDHFDPTEFASCIDFSGYSTESPIEVACTEVHKGRYVSVSMPTDGIVRAETDQKVLSICSLEVYGRPVRRLGAPCHSDHWCQLEDQNMICDTYCVCAKGYVQAPEYASKVCVLEGILGSPCHDDDVCQDFDRHMRCSLGSCECSVGFAYNDLADACIAVGVVGRGCDEEDDCNVFDLGSECEGKVCQCKAGYGLSELSSMCVRIGVNGMACSSSSQCMDNNMDCFGGVCLCVPGYVYNEYQIVCIPETKYGKICNTHEYCHESHMICDIECVCEAEFEFHPYAYACLPAPRHGKYCALEGDWCSGKDPNLECVVDTCECKPGFLYHNTAVLCTRIGMYETECENAAECQVMGEDFRCSSGKCRCWLGFVYNKIAQVCIDENECNHQFSPCDPEDNGISIRCENRVGDYQCVCEHPGYMFDGSHCADVDECDDEGKICEHNCTNVPGSFVCECDEGFALTSKFACTDIDECETTGLPPCQQICLNIPGSFICDCEDGYTTMGTSCSDINECLTDNGGCDHTCNNVPGSYGCDCLVGYEHRGLENHLCRDIDECMAPNICTGAEHGVCVNLDGFYMCECELGYLWNGVDSCYDMNECDDVHNALCAHTCTNTNGSYACSCHPGYELQADHHTCADKDECDDHPCPGTYGQCENTLGSYECHCSHDGYHWDDYLWICVDYHECGFQNGGCMHRCYNVSGGYMCGCHPGFELDLDEKSCIDIDECLNNTTECYDDEYGLCENTEGSYHCTCMEGWEWNQFGFYGGFCSDILECFESNGGCEHQCANSYGSYYCVCFAGYFLGLDEHSCHDTDECLEIFGAPDPCTVMDSSSVCMNTIGSYHCTCPDPGYDWMGTHCQDIDECGHQNGGCVHHCENTEGSYTCDCDSGFILLADHHSCQDYDECEYSQYCAESEHSHCVNTLGSYSCTCIDGYLLSSVHECVDILECDLNNGGCMHECHNTAGSYMCRCEEGYHLNRDGHSCTDINECREEEHGCEQLCENIQGGYSCACHLGFALHEDNKTCEDIDECEDHNAGCEQICDNTEGSYVCSCRNGHNMLHTACLLEIHDRYVSTIIIWFHMEFHNYLGNHEDERTKSTAEAMQEWVSRIGHTHLEDYGFVNCETTSFIKGDMETTGAVINLEFDMFLEQRDVSRVVWKFSQELRKTTGIEVRERPMLQPLTTPGEGLQLVYRGPHAEQILVSIADECSIYDALTLCKNDGYCKVDKENIPECRCTSGHDGEFCSEDDDISTEAIVIIAVGGGLLLLILPVMIICCCLHESSPPVAASEAARKIDCAPQAAWYQPAVNYWRPRQQPSRYRSQFVSRDRPENCYHYKS